MIRVINIALIALAIVSAGQIVKVFYAPKESAPVVETFEDKRETVGIESITKIALFTPPKEKEQPVVDDKSLDHIKLNGVFMDMDDPQQSVVSIESGGNGDKIVHVGDELEPGVTLESVQSDGATIRQDGVNKRLLLPKGKIKDKKKSGPTNGSRMGRFR